jgi:ribosomal protein L35
MKTSVRKRIRVTKNGKLIRRPMAVDHFRTKKSRKLIQQKRKGKGLDYPHAKIINY